MKPEVFKARQTDQYWHSSLIINLKTRRQRYYIGDYFKTEKAALKASIEAREKYNRTGITPHLRGYQGYDIYGCYAYLIIKGKARRLSDSKTHAKATEKCLKAQENYIKTGKILGAYRAKQ